MKQEVIPYSTVARPMSGPSRLIGREKLLPAPQRLMPAISRWKTTPHQWSLDAILQRFADCCRQINSELTECHIRGIAVTTFGVDGALVDKQGNLLYPIISWKCPRTAAVMDNIEQLISAQRLQAISGVGAFSFNTLYKLVWLKKIIHNCWNARTPALYFVAD